VTINVGEMQRLLSLKAEREPGHRFDDLFGLVCDTDWLWLAYDHVAQNAGSKTAGCDGIDMAQFDGDAEGNLKRLREALESGTFVARPVRRVYIPKANGKVRPLGIPTIRDRIVQEAIRMVLEPIYEADFCQCSFGFRPNRCTMDAIRYITLATTESKKFFWVVEGDISAYFDTIHHRKLMKLLRRRVKDVKLLDLIWQFLRAGVMERKLFKPTDCGTPQGGIVSPLLANVYLHELDKYMEKYTALPTREKRRRRKQGLANYAYVRYADDFVVLCNGTREHAEALRDELHAFLSESLRLTLSMEKTKVTHLNDGFDFLGFTLRRCMGSRKVGVKTLISRKGIQRHRDILRAATAPGTQADSVRSKILALNRIIAGWCRYYQYTSKASTQFGELENATFWLVVNWLARKHRLRMPEALRRFRRNTGLGVEGAELLRHTRFHTLSYKRRLRKPNPYTTQEVISREELLDTAPLTGHEARPGMMDLRPLVLQRDQYRCRRCKEPVTASTCAVDHVRPVRCFKRPVEANYLENLRTLCLPCHQKKTEEDRRRESRMR
jgi:RNA-directed DNA polymerase